MADEKNPFSSFNFGLGNRTAAQGVGDALLGFAGRPELALENQQRRSQAAQGGTLAQLYQEALASGQDPARFIMNDPRTLEIMGSPGGMEQIAQLREMAAAPTAKPLVTQPGDILRDPRDPTKIIAQNPPREPEAPNSIREAKALGFDLATAAGQAAYAAYKRSLSHAPGGTKIINQIGTPTPDDPFAGIGMKRLEGLDEKAANAAAILPELDAMKSAMDAGAHQPGFGPNVGVKTPWGTVGLDVEAATVPFLQMMAKMGLVDEERLSETELFSTIRSRLGPLLRPQGSGSSSDSDVALFLDALPGLSKSREGNYKIIEFYKRIHERNIQEMELMERMLRAHNYSPSAFRRATAKLGDLFTAEDEKALDRAMAGPEPAKSHGAINVATGERTPGSPVDEAAISKMSREDIMMLDISGLTPAQRAAVSNRMSQLGM